MPMEQFAILMALKAVSRQCPVKSQETFRNIEIFYEYSWMNP